MKLFTVFGFLVCVLAVDLLLRRIRPEFVPLSLAASTALLAMYLLKEGISSLTVLQSIASEHGLGQWMAVLLKALGIALSSEMTAALCRDCGESALAEKALLAGKVALLSLTLPVLKQVLSLL